MPLDHKVTFKAKVQHLNVSFFVCVSKSCSITYKSSSSPLLSCKHDCLIIYVIYNHRKRFGAKKLEEKEKAMDMAMSHSHSSPAKP